MVSTIQPGYMVTIWERTLRAAVCSLVCTTLTACISDRVTSRRPFTITTYLDKFPTTAFELAEQKKAPLPRPKPAGP